MHDISPREEAAGKNASDYLARFSRLRNRSRSVAFPCVAANAVA
jgi:hypothetical protein